jgi:hypothetical protein
MGGGGGGGDMIAGDYEVFKCSETEGLYDTTTDVRGLFKVKLKNSFGFLIFITHIFKGHGKVRCLHDHYTVDFN